MPKVTDSVRRDNLRALIAEHGASNLASQLGYTNPSFLSQMAGPRPIRDITEKTARRFEAKLGLPKGYLDRTDKPVQQSTHAPLDVPLTTEVITLVGRVLNDEGVTLPPLKLAELVNLAIVDASANGGQPRDAILKSVVRLLK